MLSDKLPRPQSYDDFRAYLHDIIELSSRSTQKVPMLKFAEAFGLGRSHLSMVLSGERPLTLKNIHGIAQALHMKQSDHEYWEALVLYSQAKDQRERSYYRTKLGQQRAARSIEALGAEAYLSFRGQDDIPMPLSTISSKTDLKKLFEEGLEQLEQNFASKSCLFNGTTFSISDKDIHRFTADYEKLLERYRNATGVGTKKVVQANIQFFPVI